MTDDQTILAEAEAALTQTCDGPGCDLAAQVFVKLHDCRQPGGWVRVVCLGCSFRILAELGQRLIHAKVLGSCVACPVCRNHFHEVSDFIIDKGSL